MGKRRRHCRSAPLPRVTAAAAAARRGLIAAAAVGRGGALARRAAALRGGRAAGAACEKRSATRLPAAGGTDWQHAAHAPRAGNEQWELRQKPRARLQPPPVVHDCARTASARAWPMRTPCAQLTHLARPPALAARTLGAPATAATDISPPACVGAAQRGRQSCIAQHSGARNAPAVSPAPRAAAGCRPPCRPPPRRREGTRCAGRASTRACTAFAESAQARPARERDSCLALRYQCAAHAGACPRWRALRLVAPHSAVVAQPAHPLPPLLLRRLRRGARRPPRSRRFRGRRCAAPGPEAAGPPLPQRRPSRRERAACSTSTAPARPASRRWWPPSWHRRTSARSTCSRGARASLSRGRCKQARQLRILRPKPIA